MKSTMCRSTLLISGALLIALAASVLIRSRTVATSHLSLSGLTMRPPAFDWFAANAPGAPAQATSISAQISGYATNTGRVAIGAFVLRIVLQDCGSDIYASDAPITNAGRPAMAARQPTSPPAVFDPDAFMAARHHQTPPAPPAGYVLDPFAGLRTWEVSPTAVRPTPTASTKPDDYCDTIGDAESTIGLPIPSAETRWLDGAVNFQNLPPIRGTVHWSYSVVHVNR